MTAHRLISLYDEGGSELVRLDVRLVFAYDEARGTHLSDVGTVPGSYEDIKETISDLFKFAMLEFEFPHDHDS